MYKVLKLTRILYYFERRDCRCEQFRLRVKKETSIFFFFIEISVKLYISHEVPLKKIIYDFEFSVNYSPHYVVVLNNY